MAFLQEPRPRPRAATRHGGLEVFGRKSVFVSGEAVSEINMLTYKTERPKLIASLPKDRWMDQPHLSV